MSESKDSRIAALLRERVGYVRYGKDSRVKDVDAELERLGYEEPKKKSEPKQRSTREAKQSTADAAPKKRA